MKIDERIIKLLLKGKNAKAFDLIVENYQSPLYFTIRNIVISHAHADDVLQNTFIKIWQNLASFKAQSQFKTWATRIAINESLNYLKKEKKYYLDTEDTALSMMNLLESDVYYDGDEIQKTLRKAILTLPEKQRTVFNLKYFDELKYTEIQEVLGGSIGNLKAAYHHACEKIKKFVSND